MTKQQLIRLILDAATTGKLEDAEKAIDEYVRGLRSGLAAGRKFEKQKLNNR